MRCASFEVRVSRLKVQRFRYEAYEWTNGGTSLGTIRTTIAELVKFTACMAFFSRVLVEMV